MVMTDILCNNLKICSFVGSINYFPVHFDLDTARYSPDKHHSLKARLQQVSRGIERNVGVEMANGEELLSHPG